MLIRIAAIVGIAALAALAVSPAQALSMKDCSVKYKAAQDAGTLDGMKWNDFRKANCGADATADVPAATTAKAAPTPAVDPGEPSITNTEHAAEPAAASIVAPKNVVFPKAVDPQYASQSAGKARMHTCLDQYRINKAKNALGGLKWIQKGGGYYSLCNTRLKG